MTHSTSADRDPNSTSTLPEQPGVLVAKRHHLLVRWSHWLNVPILLGLILSGISIYWASRTKQANGQPCAISVAILLSWPSMRRSFLEELWSWGWHNGYLPMRR
jgi:cytochrome b subunit of formate dehydrogenase